MVDSRCQLEYFKYSVACTRMSEHVSLNQFRMFVEVRRKCLTEEKRKGNERTLGKVSPHQNA